MNMFEKETTQILLKFL